MEMRARVCDLLGRPAIVRLVPLLSLTSAWRKSSRLTFSGSASHLIKTVNKMGSIDAAAKKFGVDLTID